MSCLTEVQTCYTLQFVTKLHILQHSPSHFAHLKKTHSVCTILHIFLKYACQFVTRILTKILILHIKHFLKFSLWCCCVFVVLTTEVHYQMIAPAGRCLPGKWGKVHLLLGKLKKCSSWWSPPVTGSNMAAKLSLSNMLRAAEKNLNSLFHIDGLVQERRNSSAIAMVLRLSCTNPWVSVKKT